MLVLGGPPEQNLLFPSDNIDCESSNILYLATCRLCPDNLQYAGAARDIKLEIANIQVRLVLLLLLDTIMVVMVVVVRVVARVANCGWGWGPIISINTEETQTSS